MIRKMQTKKVNAHIAEPLREGILSLAQIIINNEQMRDLQEWGIDNGIDMDNEGNINLDSIDVPQLQEIYSDLEVLAFGDELSDNVASSMRKKAHRSVKAWKGRGHWKGGKGLTAKGYIHGLKESEPDFAAYLKGLDILGTTYGEENLWEAIDRARIDFESQKEHSGSVKANMYNGEYNMSYSELARAEEIGRNLAGGDYDSTLDDVLISEEAEAMFDEFDHTDYENEVGSNKAKILEYRDAVLSAYENAIKLSIENESDDDDSDDVEASASKPKSESISAAKYDKTTLQGYEIKETYYDSQRGGNKLSIIGYRPRMNDYFIGLGYDPETGEWNQGMYDYDSEEEASNALLESYPSARVMSSVTGPGKKSASASKLIIKTHRVRSNSNTAGKYIDSEDEIVEVVNNAIETDLQALCEKYRKQYNLAKCSYFTGMWEGQERNHYDDSYKRNKFGISFVVNSNADEYVEEDDRIVEQLTAEAKPLVAKAIAAINSIDGINNDKFFDGGYIKTSVSAKDDTKESAIGDYDLLGYTWWGAIDGYVIEVLINYHTEYDEENDNDDGDVYGRKDNKKGKVSAENLGVDYCVFKNGAEIWVFDKSNGGLSEAIKYAEKEKADYILESAWGIAKEGMKKGMSEHRGGKKVWSRGKGKINASKKVRASMSPEDAAYYFTQYANYQDDESAMEWLLPAFEKIQAVVNIDWGNINDDINEKIFNNLNAIAEEPSVLSFLEEDGWQDEALRDYLESEHEEYIIGGYDEFVELLGISDAVEKNEHLLSAIYNEVDSDDDLYEVNGYANGFNSFDPDDYRSDVELDEDEDWDDLSDDKKLEKIKDAGLATDVDTGYGWWDWADDVGGDDWETQIRNLEELDEAFRNSFDGYNGLMYLDNYSGGYYTPDEIEKEHLADAIAWKLEQELGNLD